MGLPYGIEQLRIVRLPEVAEKYLFAVVTPKPDGSFDAELCDRAGNIYLALAGYRTMELPESVAVGLLKPLQEALRQ